MKYFKTKEQEFQNYIFSENMDNSDSDFSFNPSIQLTPVSASVVFTWTG